MTKGEQNQIIKESLVRNLQKETEIPEDIGEIYKNWLELNFLYCLYCCHYYLI